MIIIKNNNFINYYNIFIFIIFAIIMNDTRLYANQDSFEPDNSPDSAKIIYLQNPLETKKLFIQEHNFYDNEDRDWIKFFVKKGNTYTIIATPDQGMLCDPMIEIFTSKTDIRIDSKDDHGPGEEEYIQWTSQYEGLNYAKISQCDPYSSGCHFTFGKKTSYKLTFIKPDAGVAFGYISGYVQPCNQYTKNGMTTIKTIYNNVQYGEAITLPDCGFLMTNEAGNYLLHGYAQGYRPFQKNITVSERRVNDEDITLSRFGDVNANDKIDTVDVIMTLEYISEMNQ